MSYTIHPRGIEKGVVRDSDKAFIPNDPKNANWVEYEKWVAAGNSAAAYVEPADVTAAKAANAARKQAVDDLLNNPSWNSQELEAAVRLILNRIRD